MILPVESFSDVVSFLGYYDLGGLKLANKIFSAVANKCADAIRLFDSSDFSFYIYDDYINVYRLDPDGNLGSWVCQLKLTSEENLVNFVSEAFRNCTVGRLILWGRNEHILHAIRVVAHTIIVARTLHFIHCFENAEELFQLVDAFRQAKNLKVLPSYRMSRHEKKSLKSFCQRKGIVIRL